MNIRKFFPAFKLNKKNIYLDNAATSLKLGSVIKSVNNYYTNFSLNPHSFSDNYFHREIKCNIDETRNLISAWINCSSEEIIFTPSTTYSINIVALTLSEILKKGDSVLITKFEHSSNVYPWVSICNKKEAVLDYLPLNEDFTIDEKNVDKKINDNVKIVSLAHVSNNLGIINDVKKLTKLIKEKNPDCIVIVDACQSIANEKIDVSDWGVDGLVFSGHKVYGPTGIGVLYLRKKIFKNLPDVLWGGGKEKSPLDNEVSDWSLLNNKFEVGTLPLSQIFGLRQVFIFLNSLEWNIKKIKEKKIVDYAIKELEKIEDIVIYNKETNSNILLFNFKGIHSHDLTDYLSKNNIFVRGGSFCSPFLKELIGVNSSVRISFAIYNNKKDVNSLINCLKSLNKSDTSYYL